MTELEDINNIPKFIEAFQTAKLEWMKDIGDYLAQRLREYIAQQKGNWKRLHPVTVMRKGHAYKLIESKRLLGSITWMLVSAHTGPGQGEVMIGIINDPRNASLMFIHEKGARIRVTPKMRAFLHYIGIHLKTTTKIITIPARPVFGPVADEEMDNVVESYTEMFNELLGEFGVK